MKPSRFFSARALYALFTACGLSLLSSQTFSQTENNSPNALPSTPAAEPGQLPHEVVTPEVTPPPTNAESPKQTDINGKDRLKSAYDRSSNPEYYEMLDKLERNQHHIHYPSKTYSTPHSSRKHHNHKAHHRSKHHKHSAHKHSKHKHTTYNKHASHKHTTKSHHSKHSHHKKKGK